MNSDQFNTLSHTQKTDVVLAATFLADRLDGHHYIRLYNQDNFYIEAFFDERYHQLTHFRAFEHTLFVMPYLDEVMIAV